MSETTESPSFLQREDGTRIAYRVTPGAEPGVVFLPGFKSDMIGTKATYLETWCRHAGHAFVRFDYRGHGASSGTFREGTIGAWAEDALHVLDQLTSGRQILVGSSMGGWLMLLAALRRPQRIAALVGIAAAPDFTESIYRELFDDAQRAALDRDGEVAIPDCYGGEPYPITRRLIEEGREHLLLGEPIPIEHPVRLIQGLRDEDVPWQLALRIAERVTTTDVEVTLVKDGGHRLSEPAHLALLAQTLQPLLTLGA